MFLQKPLLWSLQMTKDLLWNQNVIQMSEMIDKVGAVVGERFIRLSHWKYQMGICTANHSILLSFSFSVFLLTIWLTTVYKGFLIPWVLIVASCSFLQITDIFFFYLQYDQLYYCKNSYQNPNSLRWDVFLLFPVFVGQFVS